MNAETLSDHPLLQYALTRVLDGLNTAEQAYMDRMGYTHKPDQWHTKERAKYIAIDCGGSGAFLVRREDGEIFNIHGYGKPDQNKKRKADLGNICSVDPAWLHARRYNYLR